MARAPRERGLDCVCLLLTLCSGVHGAEGPAAIQARAKPNAATPARTNLRVDSSLVLIPISVTDPLNRPVLGLQKSDFRVFDRNQEQQVLHLTYEDAPMAVGILFDTSSSMQAKIRTSRAAVREFFKSAVPGDEFFLVEFGSNARLIQPLTSEPADVLSRLDSTAPRGRTALFDAVALGLKELKRATARRRALLILSDGGDNRSRYTEQEIRLLAGESGASIYALGIFEKGSARLAIDQIEAPAILGSLADRTGGRMSTVERLADLPAMTARIGVEMHNCYVLAYAPDNLAHDGKHHRVTVQVVRPGGLPPVRVAWRTGYHAPLQCAVSLSRSSPRWT